LLFHAYSNLSFNIDKDKYQIYSTIINDRSGLEKKAGMKTKKSLTDIWPATA